MFGDFLISHGVIDKDQLDKALSAQKEIGKPLGETLVHLGFLELSALELYLERHLLHRASDLINDPDLVAQ